MKPRETIIGDRIVAAMTAGEEYTARALSIQLGIRHRAVSAALTWLRGDGRVHSIRSKPVRWRVGPGPAPRTVPRAV